MPPESNPVAEFTQHHGFHIPEILKEDDQSIKFLLDVKRSVDDAVSTHAQSLLDKGDPSWAMLLTMLDRVYEHAAASVVAHFTGCWASLEVIVRATIEAAATVLYVTQSDRDIRLGQYLTHYFAYTRKAIENCDPSVRVQALRNLEKREHIIRAVADHENIPFDVLGWPSGVLARFKAVGMEAEYRHLYAVLSGQAHNDAESLIDYVIIRSLAGHVSHGEARAGAEVYYWIRFYLYSGLRYYAIAAHGYATALELLDPMRETKRVETELAIFLQRLTQDFQASTTIKPSH